MITKADLKSKFVNKKMKGQKTMKATKTTKPKFVERARPESYSVTIACRVKPSEKAVVTEYAKKNGVTLDTVLRSALVAFGVLAG